MVQLLHISNVLPLWLLLLIERTVTTTDAFVIPSRNDRAGIILQQRRRPETTTTILRRRVMTDPTTDFLLMNEEEEEVRLLHQQPQPSLTTLDSSSSFVVMSDKSNLETTSADTTIDVGKAIFLANSKENAELIEVIDLVNEQPDQLDRVIVDNLSANQTESSSTSCNSHGMDKLPETFVVPSPADASTVSAILEASSEAVAAAEAQLLDGGTTFGAPLVEESTKTTFTSAVVETTAAASTQMIQAPSVGKILRFAIPAIGVWLCSPLLSLIDTSAVGILSGTVQQAALNPAVAVTDYTALLIAFMYTGTTNLIAAARVQDQNDAVGSTSSRTKRTLIGVLKLSTYVGLALGSVLFIFANPLLRTLIGNDSISPQVMDAAMKYVQIRALGMPAAAVMGSAQAACLGMQDIKSPLYVLAAAAAVNFLGDMLFVGSSHPWIGGAAGAAWATVFSQYAALAMFLHWLRHKHDRNNNNNDNKLETTTTSLLHNTKKPTLNISSAILELTTRANNQRRLQRFTEAVVGVTSGTTTTTTERTAVDRASSSTRSALFSKKARYSTKQEEKETNTKNTEEASFSVRGFLHGSLRKRDLIQFPNRETLRDFAPYVIPVTTTMVGRLSGYVAMSHVVSSSLGTVSMAAQQVVLSLFYCLTPIADSLSLTAQSFLPSLTERPPSREQSMAMRQTVSNFFKAAGIFGATMVAAVSCVPLLSGMFTTDPNVIALVNMVVPLLMGIFSVHGLVCSSEGLLLGRKDLGFLGKMYAGFFAIVPYCMLRVKRAALSSDLSLSGHVNLTSVWKVFLGYQLFRTVVWICRLSFLQRQSDAMATSAEAARARP